VREMERREVERKLPRIAVGSEATCAGLNRSGNDTGGGCLGAKLDPPAVNTGRTMARRSTPI